jgi:hypothetical protein
MCMYIASLRGPALVKWFFCGQLMQAVGRRVQQIAQYRDFGGDPGV